MLLPLDALRAADLIAKFRAVPILVVGDVMIDRFIVGRVTRISPEAPVPIVRFQSQYVRLGGAANVANNVAALGGRATLVGIIGADDAGKRLRDALRDLGSPLLSAGDVGSRAWGQLPGTLNGKIVSHGSLFHFYSLTVYLF